ncbi:hypothetical protein GE061_019152 [Apolygus lucorum]|uniref:Uncharacterized protein n=1 Tax=Apolygus lucorum TaxID=248454 RepID=A0A6A4JRX2_APOLU|nr:hypothetical protein GE061_019152 [Apolygus lucorum]
MYLKVRAKLNEDAKVVDPVCPKISESFGVRDCIFEKGDRQRDLNSKRKYVHQECKQKKTFERYPTNDPHFEAEPTYKNIFKNARNNRKPPDVREEVILLNEPSCMDNSEFTASTIISMVRESSSPAKPCELMADEENNYLLEVRERRRLSKKMNSQDHSRLDFELDDVTAMFQSVPMKTVMHDNLDDQIDLTKAIIGERLTRVDPEDEMKGLNYMKHKMLGNIDKIDEFQEKFIDERWRRKFDLEKIEHSDYLDSTDESEIYISESSSLCSQDSMGTSVDLRNRHPKKSRIPYVEEVHQMKESHFEKISRKWEKVVKKNLIEPNLNLTPIFRGLYTDVRLRSANKFYQGILESLNDKYEKMYHKKLIPYKYRLREWNKKNDEMTSKADDLFFKRRMFESANLVNIPYPEEPKLIDYTPTKHLTDNQRVRLKRIMKDIENREEDGLTDWRKEALVEEYVNLRPIIKTKAKCHSKSKPTSRKRLISKDQSLTKSKMVNFSQLGTDSSTFFFPRRQSQVATQVIKKYFPMGV